MGTAIRRAFCVLMLIAVPMTVFGAVTSTGEINVLDDPTGRVPTSSKPTLVLTLLVDRSQAEVGEEIKTIETLLPNGFSMTGSDVRDVRIEGARVPHQPVVGPTFFRVVLEKAIDNFLSSIIQITFDVQTPELPQKEALFRVALRNLQDRQIGEFIKPGEIDGDPANNNDYTLEVFPNVPPSPPTGVTVKPDADGENDALISWEPVREADVKGYFVIRDNATSFDATGPERSSFRDVNVPEGDHTYTVVAYKSKLVVSTPSVGRTVQIGRDTKPPQPVPALTVEQIAQGTKLIWATSASPDVVAYRVVFARGGASPQVVQTIPANPAAKEYEFIHRAKLDVGRYRYGVVAVDEAGNASSPIEKSLAIFDTPSPNPFTPLGAPPFNRVTFPVRAIRDAEGDLTVRIFDLHGRLVRELEATGGDATWDGRDADNALLPGGIYVYQMEIGGQFRIGTIVLIR